MKVKQLFLPFLVVALVACAKNQTDEPDNKVTIDSNLFLTEFYSVSIANGLVTRVSIDNREIALTDLPMSIQVPKGANLTVEQLSYSDLPEFVKGSGVSSESYVLLFEDSRKADYDYNDLVLYIRHDLVVEPGGKRVFDIEVKPIAMGASKEMKFGYIDATDGVEVILSKDVRSEYFGGQNGMLNTYPQTPFFEPISTDGDRIDVVRAGVPRILRVSKKQTDSKNKPEVLKCGSFRYVHEPTLVENSNIISRRLNYFIEVDNGKRFFVCEVEKGSGGTLPYGIAIPTRLDTYPIENQRMDEVFPDFNKWILDPNTHLDWYEHFTDKGYKLDFEPIYRWYSKRIRTEWK